MPLIQLSEDSGCAALHPFHHIDGVAGIRFGAFTQAERWAEIESSWTSETHPKTSVLEVNARWVPDGNTLGELVALDAGDQLLQGDITLAKWRGDHQQGNTCAPSQKAHLLTHANDLFTGLSARIEQDLEIASELWKTERPLPLPHTLFFGDTARWMASPSAVNRAASISTEEGPVIIGPHAVIEPGAHLRGPLVICESATIRMGTRISGPTVIGPHCKVGGEISNVNFQGWANKAHDGFLGNSVIGRWCNLGAGTESSNLKNTYGEVRQWNAVTGKLEGTGLQFCGLLMGDHSKCGIGTTFNTGTVIDPASVIFDAGFPPKHLPPFSWYNARNEKMEVQSLDRMLDTADRVMARRGLKLSEAQRDNLARLYAERIQSEG